MEGRFVAVLMFVLGAVAGWIVAMGGYIVWTELLGGFDREGAIAMGVAFTIGPALGQGRALAQALQSIAQQPDESNNITRTLFVGMAMVESTAIYSLVVAMIIIFFNPFWDFMVAQVGG